MIEQEQKQIIEEMVDLQRTVFKGSFNTMAAVQTRTKKVMDVFLNQAVWVPDEWRQTVDNWNLAYEEGCQSLKKKWMIIL